MRYKIRGDLNGAINQIIGKVMFKLQKEVKELTPVKTGIARNSVVVDRSITRWVLGTNLNYWEHIENGTQPHEIKAKNKNALFWKGARHPVKKVNHPGTKGLFIFKKVGSEENIRSKFEEVINERN
jgi:hypothetical protein